MSRIMVSCRVFGIAALVVTPGVSTNYGHAAPKVGSSNRCAETAAKKTRRSIIGHLGGVADRALDRAKVPTRVAGVSLPVGSMLSTAIIKLLDCKEQQQAAAATDRAIRGGVGTKATWKSETHSNVSGYSAVTNEQKLADGTHCFIVSDVVIVEGEETTVPKRMCRSKGGTGYARV